MPCDRAYAGCTAIAMAQVMKFHQKPTSYSWNLMPNSSGSTATATLIKAIDDALPANYTCSGTQAYPSQAAPAFKSTFGYSSATLSSYDQSSVVSNLRYNKPVILGGGSGSEGHAWVCDGFQKSKICIFDNSGMYVGSCSYLYLSMNWGWNYAQGNGCYAFDNFNPMKEGEIQNFNSNRQMIYNIIS